MPDVVNEHPYQPTLKLGDFEGPLDLLLHLIRVNEMDIYDIPISEITDQYMGYLHQMQQHQLEVAGDYFVMAATLMSIKSRMLLPDPVDEDESEEPADEEDPRQQLVEQLLEYQRYQKAAANLKDKEELRSQEFTRAAMTPDTSQIAVKVKPGVTISQLQHAFMKVLKRHELAQPVEQTVRGETISVADKIQSVIKTVKQQPTTFEQLFAQDLTRDNLVTTFMAILELAKHQAVKLAQDSMFGTITVAAGKRIEEYQKDE